MVWILAMFGLLALLLAVYTQWLSRQSVAAIPSVPPCDSSGQWSTPSLVSSKSVDLVVRSASIVSTRSGTLLAGNTVGTFDDRLVPARPMVIAQLGLGPIVLPPGNYSFIAPVALTHHGGVDVLWGEPVEDGRRLRGLEWPPTVISIWSASLSETRKWSTPVRVFTASMPGTGWLVATRGLGAAGEPTVAFPVRTTDDGGEIVILSRRAAGWNVERIPLQQVAYASLTPFAGGRLLAAIAPATDVESDQNSVFVLMATEPHAPWSAPQLVFRSGAGAAYDIHAEADARGTAHLVWRQRDAGGRSAVVHTESHDGRTWSAPAMLEVSGYAFNLKAAVAACGAVHVVYEHLERHPASVHVDHAIWAQRWTAGHHLFPHLRSHGLGFTRDNDGHQWLSFLAQPVAAPLDAPLSTLIAKWERHVPPFRTRGRTTPAGSNRGLTSFQELQP